MSWRRPRCPLAVLATVATAVSAGVLISAAPAGAAGSDRLAPLTATSPTTYSQTFTRSDGAVTATYTVVGSVTEDTTGAVAPLSGSGADAATYVPAAARTSTGAALAVGLATDCGTDPSAGVDCGSEGRITIDFDRPVTDPTLHVTGLGERVGPSGLGAALTVTESRSATGAADAARLTAVLPGASGLSLVGGVVSPTAGLPSSSCTVAPTDADGPAGCGSVQVSGSNLTSLTLGFSLRAAGPVLAGASDRLLLTMSVPEVAPVLGAFTCGAGDPYTLEGPTGSVLRVDASTGSATFTGRIAAVTGDVLDAFALAPDGRFAYAVRRDATGGTALRLYRYDAGTGTTTVLTGPVLSGTGPRTVTAGTIDPVSDTFVVATVGDAGMELYGYDLSAARAVPGRLATLTGVMAVAGLDVDASGRLAVLAAMGTGGRLIAVTGPAGNGRIPTSGADVALTGEPESDLDTGSLVTGGAAVPATDGLLLSTSGPAGTVLHRAQPLTGTVTSGGVPVTRDGQAVSGLVDLATCTPHASVQAQVSVGGRVDPGDQFTVGLEATGLAAARTGTTTGSVDGRRSEPGATAGPVVVSGGDTVRLSLSGEGSATDVRRYLASWSCSDLRHPDAVVASGTGTSAALTVASPADGVALGCVFAVEPLRSSLGLDVTLDQPTYRAGAGVTATVTLTNTGNGDLSAVHLTPPAGTACAAVPGPLAAGASTVVTCSALAGATTATAAFAADATDRSGEPVTAAGSATVTVIHPALTLDLGTPDVASPAAGRSVTVPVDVTNSGDVALTAVDAAATTSGSGTAPTVTCPTQWLAPSATTRCTLTLVLAQPDVDHGGVVVTVTAAGIDPRSAPVSSGPTPVTVELIMSPALTVTATADRTTVAAIGDVVHFAIRARNNGNVTLAGLAVHTGSGPPSCPGAALAPGETVRCTLDHATTQADLDAGFVQLDATASATAPDRSTVDALPSHVVVTADAAPSVSLLASSTTPALTRAGQSVTYTLVVTNTGNQTLTALTVLGTPAAGGSTVSGACAPTVLAPGASVTCRATRLADQGDIDAGGPDLGFAATAAVASGPVTSAESRVLVAATAAPALTLSETAPPRSVDQAGPSSTVTFSFAVRNTGNVTVHGLEIADQLEAPAAPALAVSCPAAVLAPGAATTCTATYEPTQDDLDHGAISDAAAADAAAPDGRAVSSAPAAATVAVTRRPALTAVQTVSPPRVASAGDVIGVAVDVTNTGNQSLVGLSVGDLLADPASTPIPVSCPVLALAPGRTAHCTGAHTVTQPDLDAGSLTATATATASDPLGATVTAPPAAASVGVAGSPGLTATVDTAPAGLNAAGQQVDYTIRVTNSGNRTVTQLAVSAVATAPAAPAPDVTCPVTRLAPGETTACTASYVTVQADIDAGGVRMEFAASGRAPDASRVDADPVVVDIRAARRSRLALVSSAAPAAVTAAGERVTFSFAATNTGNTTLRALSIRSAPAAPATALLLDCPATDLAPGATAVCTAAYTAAQDDIDAGSIVVSADASALDPTSAAVTAPTSAAVVQVNTSAALTATTSVTPGVLLRAGRSVAVSVLVTNTGNVTVTAVTASAVFVPPAGAAVLTCPRGVLAPLRSVTCSGVYVATQADVDHGSVDLAGSAAARDPNGLTVLAASTAATVEIAARPALTLTATSDPTRVDAPGVEVQFSYLLTNTGNVTVDGLTVDATLDAPATALGVVACPAATLAPGASTTCSAAHTVAQIDLDHGSIRTQSHADGRAPDGSTVTTAGSAATVDVVREPRLAQVVDASPRTVSAAGDVITVRQSVTNPGNVSLSRLMSFVVPAVPAGPASTPTCDATELAPGDETVCASTYLVTQADLDSGAIHLRSLVRATDPGGTTVSSSPATSSISVVQSPALTVTGTANPEHVTGSGQSVSYRFTVANPGNVTITRLAVTQAPAAPAGVVPVVTCASRTVVPGGTVGCRSTYRVTIADMDRGTIATTVTALGQDPNLTSVASAPLAVDVVADRSPAVSVTITGDPVGPTAIGQPVRFSSTVTNTGNVTLSDLRLLPSLTAPAGPLPSPRCPLARLAPGSAQSCTLDYTTTAADFDTGFVELTGVATAAGPAGRQVTSDRVAARVATVTVHGLSLVSTVEIVDHNGNGAADLDDKLKWRFRVTNTGNTTVGQLSVNDPVAGPVTCSRSELGAGARTVCVTRTGYAIGQGDVDAGHVDTTAVSNATDVFGSPVVSNPQSTSTTIGSHPGMGLVQSGTVADTNRDGVADPGDRVEWTFTVANTGDVTLTDVSVLASGTPVVTCAVHALTPRQTTTCVAMPTTPVAVHDFLSRGVSGSGLASGVDPDGNRLESPRTHATIRLRAAPGLSVSATAQVQDGNRNGSLGAGDTLRWQYIVTNTGNVPLRGLEVETGSGTRLPCAPTTLAPTTTARCLSAVHVITPSEERRASVNGSVRALALGIDGRTVTSPPAVATAATGALSAGAAPAAAGTAPLGTGSTPLASTGAGDVQVLSWLALWLLAAGAIASAAGAVGRRRWS